MENKEKDLIHFALENFKNSIHILEQKWSFFEFQPYFDFKVEIEIHKNIYIGRGTSSSQKIALTKSIAESLERFAIDFADNQDSSNGYALHTDLALAILAAREELIERNFVMLYSLGYSEEIEIPLESLSLKIQSIISNFTEKKIEIKFFSLFEKNCRNVILCRANGLNHDNQFGLIFGSSCKEIRDEAIEKSFTEVLINLMAGLNNKIEPKCLEDIRKKNSLQPTDSLCYYFNKTVAKSYLERRINTSLPSQIFEDKFFEEEIDYPFADKFFVVKSNNHNLLQARWGLFEQFNDLANLNPEFPLVIA